MKRNGVVVAFESKYYLDNLRAIVISLNLSVPECLARPRKNLRDCDHPTS